MEYLKDSRDQVSIGDNVHTNTPHCQKHQYQSSKIYDKFIFDLPKIISYYK